MKEKKDEKRDVIITEILNFIRSMYYYPEYNISIILQITF